MIFSQTVTQKLNTVAQRVNRATAVDVIYALGALVEKPPLVVQSILADSSNPEFYNQIIRSLDGEEVTQALQARMNKRSSSRLTFSGLLQRLGIRSQQRATRMASVYEQVWNQVDALDMFTNDWNYLVDLYVDNDAMFALVSRGPHLYKGDVTMTDNVAQLGPLTMVMEEFSPVATTSTEIMRDSDGRCRFLSVSATSCLNRSSAIDSQNLFASLQRNFESGEYPLPYRTMYHEGIQLRTGTVDFVWADGPVLITSGYYEDSELADLEIAALQERSDHYGESIGYMNLAPPEYIEVNGEMIPVYNEGYLVELSTVPSGSAANLYTMPTIMREATQENDMYEMKPQTEAMIRQMIADTGTAVSDEALNSALSGISDVFRQITEGEENGNLVVRSDDSDATDSPQEGDDFQLVLNDEVIGLIVSRMVTDETALGAFQQAIAGHVQTAVSQALEDPLQQLEAINRQLTGVQNGQRRQGVRLELLTSEQDSRNTALLRELAPAPTNGRTVIPRMARSVAPTPQATETTQVVSMAETAANTVQTMKARRNGGQGGQ